jgi:hypothetical protein
MEKIAIAGNAERGTRPCPLFSELRPPAFAAGTIKGRRRIRRVDIRTSHGTNESNWRPLDRLSSSAPRKPPRRLGASRSRVRLSTKGSSFRHPHVLVIEDGKSATPLAASATSGDTKARRRGKVNSPPPPASEFITPPLILAKKRRACVPMTLPIKYDARKRRRRGR